MTYEVLEEGVEPVTEAVSLQRGPEASGTFVIDYVVSRRDRAEERGYLIEVAPQSEARARRLAACAERCRDDAYPQRDPRLERGIARAIRELRRSEVRGARGFRLRHFRAAGLLAALRSIGFTEVRQVIGGGWPARECAQELIQSQRMAAAAPLMEELCRAAGRMGIALESSRPGHVMARKPASRARRAG
jgi:hypothetical protein